MNEELQAGIESAREMWAGVARANGWYSEPFYVQVWINKRGEIVDSVATRALTSDVVAGA
jgi:hypothetical protein